jgi:two-component system, NarL family, invasion response regulator UvrY
MVGVIIVDDQAPFRRAVKAVLGAAPNFELLGEARSGEDAIALTGSLGPDLVVMDVKMPGIGGIEATRQIAATGAGALVVLVSSYREGDLPAAARCCGAVAYIHKEDFGRRLLEEVWSRRRASAPVPKGRGAPP